MPVGVTSSKMLMSLCATCWTSCTQSWLKWKGWDSRLERAPPTPIPSQPPWSRIFSGDFCRVMYVGLIQCLWGLEVTEITLRVQKQGRHFQERTVFGLTLNYSQCYYQVLSLCVRRGMGVVLHVTLLPLGGRGVVYLQPC